MSLLYGLRRSDPMSKYFAYCLSGPISKYGYSVCCDMNGKGAAVTYARADGRYVSISYDNDALRQTIIQKSFVLEGGEAEKIADVKDEKDESTRQNLQGVITPLERKAIDTIFYLYHHVEKDPQRKERLVEMYRIAIKAAAYGAISSADTSDIPVLSKGKSLAK